uniref:DNA-directed DNA polymerase n=2 Tax=Macrostomum lignano TaxID=282301 RepID=A0A1I8HEV4_9PLAT
MLRRLLQDGGGSGAETGGCRKALLVLPYVSVSREKADSLRRLFSTMGLRVGGFFGGQAPAGGLASVDAAVCTLEKANSLANRLLEEGRLDLLAAVVVDELHLIGDESRGYLLELFLTKLLFLTRRPGAPSCQVIGMSATLPGLEKLASWLGGRLYSTDYRPVPLCQMAKIGRQLLDTRLSPLGPPDSGEGGPVGALAKPDLPGDSDQVNEVTPGLVIAFLSIEPAPPQVGALCLDTVLRGHSVLVFCPTKAWCEQLADSLARIFFGLIKREGSPEGDGLRATLDYQALLEVRSQLQASPAGLDPVLGRTVPFACAFHHAGLTSEEREVLESGFRRHAIRVLVATSTLSAGVNLPARLVIVRTPTFYGRPLDPFVYRQMVGRAGRLGVDTRGESILICQPQERRVAMELLGESPLRPLASCLPTRSLRRAVLEAVASGVAQTRPEVESYIGCSLAASTGLSVLEQVADTLQQLLACDLLVRRPDDSLAATNLGCAVLASALGPDEGLQVLTELENARRGLALDTELHLVYLCTPVYCDVSGGSGPDWLLYTDLLHSLPPAEKRVAGLVGVSERYIGRRVRQLGAIGRKDEAERLDRLHRRFYTALALADLVAERGLAATSQRFRANRGQLQSLQQQAGSYAAMVTVFAARLGWSPLDQLLAQFQSRLCFGVQADLLQLIRLPLLDATRARALHRAGLRTVSEVAAARPAELERLLRQAAPFRTRREAAEADADGADEEAGRVILDAAGRPLSELEAAETIVTAAKQLLRLVALAFCITFSHSYEPLTHRDDLAALGVVWNPEKAGDSSKEAQPAKPWRRPGRQSVLVDGDDFIASQAESEPLDGGGVDGEGGDGGGSAAPAAEGADVSADIEAEQAEMSQFLDSVCSQRLLASQTAAPPAASQLPESPTSIGDEGQADELLLVEQSPESPAAVVDPGTTPETAGTPKSSRVLVEESPDTDAVTMPTKVAVCTPTVLVEQSPDASDSAGSSKAPADKSLELSGLDWPDDSFVVNSQLARLCDIGLTGQPIVRQPPETAADNPADCSDADDPCATEEGSFVVMDANAQALNVLGDTITESMLAAIDENSVVKRAAADRQGPPQPSTPVVASSPSTPRSILKASASAAASPAALLLSRKRPLANNSADASADGEVDETSDAEMAPTPSRKRVRFADLSFPDVEDAGLEKDADSSDAAVGAAPSLTPTKPALPFAVKPVTCSEAELSAFMRDTLAVKEFAFALAFEPLDPTANRDENGRPRVIRADDDPELRLSWPAGRVRCVGVALCLSESTVHYLDLTGRAVPLRQCLSLLRRKLALAKSLACFHCRRQWAAMARCLGYQLEPGCLVDPGVAAWMLDPAGKSHGITAVASRFAPGELQYLEATHRRLGAVGRRRAVAEAHAAFVLTPRLLDALGAAGLAEAFAHQEMPACVLLAKAELNGFRISPAERQQLEARVLGLMRYLEDRICALAGRRVALTDTSDLAELLFHQLRLPRCDLGDALGLGLDRQQQQQQGSRHQRHRRHPATDRDALEKLRDLHQIPGLIIDWRRLQCALTRSLQPIRMATCSVGEALKVYCEYDTCTVTGRVVTGLPNLQAVPKSFTVHVGPDYVPPEPMGLNSSFGEMYQVTGSAAQSTGSAIQSTGSAAPSTGSVAQSTGSAAPSTGSAIFQLTGSANRPSIPQEVSVRRMLIPADGCVLLSADYCQAELRIAAHLSAEPRLLDALARPGADIFRQLTAQWKGKLEDHVTEEERGHTKALCYGLLYGMTPVGLAERLGIDEAKATTFQRSFLLQFRGLQRWIDSLVAKVRETGWVSTISGKRRRLPAISHKAPSARAQAMAAIDREMTAQRRCCGLTPHSDCRGAHLLLQMHDELVFEVPAAALTDCARLVRRCMESAAPQLTVPMPVKLRTGPNWADLQELQL